MSNGQPTEKDIIKAIKASGYLMEQKVADIIESLNFHVYTNRAFEDLDESKSREIDVVGFRRFYENKETKFIVDVELICECKNNTAPFIFITRPKNRNDKQNPNPSEYLFPIQKVDIATEYFENGEPKAWIETPVFQHLKLNKNHYYYGKEIKAVQFCKMIRNGKSWNANHERIYDSIYYPLVKALVTRQKELKALNYIDPTRDLNFNFPKTINLLFPIVVLQGEIYSIDSSKREIEPEKISDITFRREIKTKTIDGNFTIDFVNIESLSNFIKTKIIPFVEHVIHEVEKSPYSFMTRRIN